MAFFEARKLLQQNYICQENLTTFQNLLKKIENYFLLKCLEEISWILTKNLKESPYHIADSFSKNKIAYDIRNEIMAKWSSKKLHSDIMDFQLQQIYSYEVVGKGVCITRMGAGRNYS